MSKIKKNLSLVMSLVMVVSLFAGIDITSVAYGDYISIGLDDECGRVDVGEEFICNVFTTDDWDGFSKLDYELYFNNEYFEISDVKVIDESYFLSITIEQGEDQRWNISADIVNTPEAGVNLFSVTIKATKTNEKYDWETGFTSMVGPNFYISAYLNGIYDYECIELPYVNCPHVEVKDFDEVPCTCENDGHEAGQRCINCGDWLSGDRINSYGHEDWDEDGICDNCSETISYIILTADKTEVNLGEEFTVTVSVDNAKGLKYGSVRIADEYGYWELVDYKFNENLTFESTQEYCFDFSFDEAVQSDSVDIVTVTYKPLKIVDISGYFYVHTSDLVMYENYEYLGIDVICPHENVSEIPEEAPTCIKNGYASGEQCDDCGEWISGHEWIDSLGGHVDEDNDSICDVCGSLTSLKIGKNIISAALGDNSFEFKAEQAGLYKIEFSQNISLQGSNWQFFNDENNIICFSKNDSMNFSVALDHYDEETYYIDITLVDNTVNGHCDKNENDKCDNCSRGVYTYYYVDFELNGSESKITTAYAYSYLRNGIIPIGGDGEYLPYEETAMGRELNSPEKVWLYPYYVKYDEEYNESKYTVTEISEGAFIDFEKMQYIVIPPTVKTIGDYAVGYTAKNTNAKIDNFVIYGCKNSAAQTYAAENGFEFRLLYDYEIKNDEAVITSVCDLFECGLLPVKIEGYPVTTIGENCFADRNLSALTLPENITTIKAGAFRNNPNLGEYGTSIHHTLKVIEDGAFDGCSISIIEYNGTPKQWNEISIGKNNDVLKNAKVVFRGTGHKDFSYVIENDSVIIQIIKDDADFSNLVVPATIDGYPVTEIRVWEQDGSNIDALKYNQITIPASVTSISEKTIGYFYNWSSDEILLIPDFKIIGVPGSYAEIYAKENGITFISVGSDEPPVDEPPVDEPAEDGKLDVKGEGGIVTDFENRISQIGEKETAETLSSMIENENFAIVDKNGKALTEKDLVGTGSKIQILDKDGNVVNEYTVLVPADIDGNGKTTAADARLALRASAKLENIEGVYAMAADVTDDSKITASDARKILRKSAGLEK